MAAQGLHLRGDPAQGGVADGVAEAVVDGLEEVDVDQREADGRLGADARQHPGEVFVEAAAIGQPGQGVVARLELHAFHALQHLALVQLVEAPVGRQRLHRLALRLVHGGFQAPELLHVDRAVVLLGHRDALLDGAHRLPRLVRLQVGPGADGMERDDGQGRDLQPQPLVAGVEFGVGLLGLPERDVGQGQAIAGLLGLAQVASRDPGLGGALGHRHGSLGQRLPRRLGGVALAGVDGRAGQDPAHVRAQAQRGRLLGMPRGQADGLVEHLRGFGRQPEVHQRDRTDVGGARQQRQLARRPGQGVGPHHGVQRGRRPPLHDVDQAVHDERHGLPAHGAHLAEVRQRVLGHRLRGIVLAVERERAPQQRGQPHQPLALVVLAHPAGRLLDRRQRRPADLFDGGVQRTQFLVQHRDCPSFHSPPPILAGCGDIAATA